MKILLLAAADSIHTLRWANGLAASGLEVVLASQQPPIDGLSASVRYVPLPFPGAIGYFRNAPLVRALVRREQPDVLNAHYASGYGTTARLTGFSPTLLSVWGADVYDVPYRSPVHRMLVRGNLRAADRIASTSHVMASQVRKIAPSVEDIVITPFGVDTDFFTPEARDCRLDDAGPIVIGTVKALTDKYGIDTLIDSVALLKSRLSAVSPDLAGRVRLRIVGQGVSRRALEKRAVEKGIGAITEFVGAVSHQDVPDELRKLDIYVALSRLDSESFGVAVIEASSCGVPVVVSDAGGLPEVVVSDETGLIVPREDPESGAEALERLVRDNDLRRRMGQNGRAHVVANYRWHDNVSTMVATYRKMALN